MRAVGYRRSLPIDHHESLMDIEVPRPEPQGRDLLVEVKAVSVNPVDTKVRRRAEPPAHAWKILGWDAAGTVVATGPEVSRFREGDDVFYAGDLNRQGTNAQFHLVDERIVGPKPKRLNWAEAAALPLTAITAWEMLFDRLDVRRPVPGAEPLILVIGGAGGVGSIAIQLARRLTDLTVIATASRPETRSWVRELGAHHVVDHGRPLVDELLAHGIGAPPFVFSTTHTDRHLDQVATLLAAQGRFGLIDDPPACDISPFKRKSASVHWEFMFTRPMFATSDILAQAELLDQVSQMVDAGTLRTTLTETLSPINAENLRRVHALIESGRARGKIVLQGWAED